MRRDNGTMDNGQLVRGCHGTFTGLFRHLSGELSHSRFVSPSVRPLFFFY